MTIGKVLKRILEVGGGGRKYFDIEWTSQLWNLITLERIDYFSFFEHGCGGYMLGYWNHCLMHELDEWS